MWNDDINGGPWQRRDQPAEQSGRGSCSEHLSADEARRVLRADSRERVRQ